MPVRAKPSKNGHAHQHNGHAPASRPASAAPPLDADAASIAAALASRQTTAGVLPPLDTVSTVDGPDVKPKPDGDKPATDGRTAQGTFACGNQFARGNPNARRMAALRAALLEAATAERMRALGAKLYELAMAGDLAAAKLLLAYAVGKAPEAVDADRLDLDEWAIADAMPTTGQFLRTLVDSVQVAAAVSFRGQHRVDGNDPAKLIARICEEDPPGPLARQLLDERKVHVGK